MSSDEVRTAYRLSLQTRDLFRTLHDAAVLTHPNASQTAIIYLRADADPITLTRAEFRSEVRRYADALRRLRVQPRQLVIIAHTQNIECMVAFWGALMMGAIPSMFPTLTDKLDPEIYMKNMAELARISEATAVMTTDAFAPSLRTVFDQKAGMCPVFSSSDVAAAGGWGNQTGAEFSQVDGSRTKQVDGIRNGRLDNPVDGSRISQNAPENESQIDPKFVSQIDLESASKSGSDSISQIDPNFDPDHDPDQVAFLQHSSGTTGLQKGVALSHRAVLNQLAAYADALDLRESDSIVSWLPLYHDMGLIAGFIMPMVQGIPLIIMSPFEWAARPIMLLKAIHDYKPTFCWLPNFAYNHMAARIRPRDSDGLDLSSIRAFINCSEPVHHHSHSQFIERFKDNHAAWEQMAVSYAMAENTFAVTQTPVGHPAAIRAIDRAALQNERRAVPAAPDEDGSTQIIHVSCGTPIPGTRVKVVDDAGKTLPADHVGEIYVQSDCMLTAYYKRPDLQPFDADGWYKTGDRGYVGEQGDVFVIGRSKDLIIHAGKNVFPQDIEAVINTVTGVHPGRAVAFGVPDEKEGTELIAVVAETDADAPDERKRISIEIRKRIGAQTDVTVSYVELVERGWLIKTSSGKIARGENRRKWLEMRG